MIFVHAFLNADHIGDYVGNCYIKGDARSLDYSSSGVGLWLEVEEASRVCRG